jgi:hypothetical protein
MNVRVRSSSEIAPKVTLTEYYEGDEEELDTVIYEDGVFSRQTPVTNGFVASSGDPSFSSLSVENLTPLICDITRWPVIEFVSEGHGRVKLTNGHCSSIQTFVMDDTSDYALIPTGFVEGSAAAFTWDIIKPLLDASANDNLFTNSPSTVPNGHYNPSCWAAGFDFTAVMAGLLFNGQWTTARGGVAITRRHVLGVYHYQHNVGDILRFAIGDGQFIQRTVIGKAQDYFNGQSVPPTNPYVAKSRAIIDAMVYVLDSDLPESVTIPKIGGDWLVKEASGSPNPAARWRWHGGAMIQINQFRQAKLVLNCAPNGSSSTSIGGESLHGVSIPTYDWAIPSLPLPAQSPLAAYTPRTYIGIPGDSGQPWFVPISETELALVCLFTYPTAGQIAREDILNTLIASADSNAGISTGLTVTVAPDPTA